MREQTAETKFQRFFVLHLLIITYLYTEIVNNIKERCSEYSSEHLSFMLFYYAFFNKSLTVFTGLNVVIGTSTKIVFQSLIAPFHKPGSSNAFRSLPFLLL